MTDSPPSPTSQASPGAAPAADAAEPFLSSVDLKTALRGRYTTPEWALLFEVQEATGSGAHRRADAVAMNLWPSRGMEIHGFEIKVTRQDWLNELKKAGKSDPVQAYCDRWWIFATPGVVKESELPESWGLYVYQDGRFVTAKEAPKLSPKPFDRAFGGSLLRRHAAVTEAEIKTQVDAEVQKIRANLEKHAEQQIAAKSARADAILQRAEAIKEATGIDVTDWTPMEEVKAALRSALESDMYCSYGSVLRHLLDLEAQLGKALGPMRAHLSQVRPELLVPPKPLGEKAPAAARRARRVK